MKHYLTLVLLLFVSLAAAAGERDNNCVFDRFVYHAQVHADHTIDVTEEIYANFLTPRHGIFQYIEQKCNVVLDGKLYEYFSPATNIEVEECDYKVTHNKHDRYIVIRIGNARDEVSGLVKYSIKYRLLIPDDDLVTTDVFFTTILGAQWANDIKEFNYSVSFDEPFPADFADKLRIYSGYNGNRDNALGVSYKVDAAARTISGYASNVAHHNGITLYAPMPEGYWQKAPHPAVVQLKWAADWLVSSLFSFSTLLFVLLLGAFIFLFVKFLLGRDSAKPLPVIEYSAPKGISSAEVGYIIDMSVDVSDLTSLIIWWASKGYLRIEEAAPRTKKGTSEESDEPEIVLHKLQDLPKNAPTYQQKFWKVFFNKKDSVQISKLGKKYKQIDAAKDALREKFEGKYELQTFDLRLFFCLLGFYLLAAFSIFVCCWSKDTYELLFAWLAAVGIGFAYRLGTADSKYFESLKGKIMSYAVMVGLFLGSLLVVFFIIDIGSSRYPSTIPYAITLLMWVLVLMSSKLQCDTPYRVEMLSRLLGFREFIRTAEAPMLKALVDENPNYFYDVLPYAVVFGLSDKWCKQFESIDFEPPTWYQTEYSLIAAEIIAGGAVVAQLLTDRFDRVISSQLETSSISPSSSGSGGGYSGGGYSGGGSGGGGGGSW